MKKIDVLCWGVQHIAENHGFEASVNYEEDGEVCIFGGCNVPTLSDVQMLCDDLGIGRENIESSEYGIDVYLTQELFDEDYEPTGMEFWKRRDAVICA